MGRWKRSRRGRGLRRERHRELQRRGPARAVDLDEREPRRVRMGSPVIAKSGVARWLASSFHCSHPALGHLQGRHANPRGHIDALARRRRVEVGSLAKQLLLLRRHAHADGFPLRTGNARPARLFSHHFEYCLRIICVKRKVFSRRRSRILPPVHRMRRPHWGAELGFDSLSGSTTLGRARHGQNGKRAQVRNASLCSRSQTLSARKMLKWPDAGAG
jgi:hypothetical protein